MASKFTNAQILSAVVSEWARPAVSQLAVSRIANINAVKSVQASIISTGLVAPSYKIASDITPFASNAIDVLLQPILEKYFSQIPDATIPQLARSITATALQQPKFSVLDGLVEFDHEDIEELRELIDKNLPLTESNTNKYKIIK